MNLCGKEAYSASYISHQAAATQHEPDIDLGRTLSEEKTEHNAATSSHAPDIVQMLLGHSNIKTTIGCTHLITPAEIKIESPLDMIKNKYGKSKNYYKFAAIT